MGRLSSGARDEWEERPELRVSVAHDLAVIDFLGDFARVSRAVNLATGGGRCGSLEFGSLLKCCFFNLFFWF